MKAILNFEFWFLNYGKKRGSSNSKLRIQNSKFAAAFLAAALAAAPLWAEEKGVGEDAALFPIVVNGKWGYMDRTGKVVIEPRFDRAQPFSEGLAAVFVNGKWGYVDSRNTMVIPARFDMAWEFSGEMAAVKTEDLWGYINAKGDFIIKPQYSWALNFRDGIAAVRKDEKLTYINSKGKTIYQTRWDFSEDTSEFSEGLVQVDWVDGELCYADGKGKIILKIKSDGMGWDFSEGLAGVQINNKWGFVDKQGRSVIAPRFDWALPFKEGLARVREGDKWYFIDRTGHIVISSQFDWRMDFSEGLAVVTVGEKKGYISKGGKFIIPLIFDDAEDFENGLACVWITDKLHYIDKTGKYVWSEPQKCKSFEEGLSVYMPNMYTPGELEAIAHEKTLMGLLPDYLAENRECVQASFDVKDEMLLNTFIYALAYARAREYQDKVKAVAETLPDNMWIAAATRFYSCTALSSCDLEYYRNAVEKFLTSKGSEATGDWGDLVDNLMVAIHDMGFLGAKDALPILLPLCGKTDGFVAETLHESILRIVLYDPKGSIEAIWEYYPKFDQDG